MRVAIIPFLAKSGTGVQTVTGVQDPTGSFIGECVIFQSGWVAVNTVTSGAAGVGTYTDSRGVDTGTIRSALSASGLYSPFNFKAQDGAQSLGDDSLVNCISDTFGSGVIDRSAKITAFRSGEFDLTYTTNNRTGDTVIAIVIAEIDITFTSDTNGTKTTPSKPQGILAIPTRVPASSGGTSVGTGGHNVPWGFATRDGDYGTACLNVVNQGSNFSAQLATAFSSGVDGSGVLAGDQPTISAWNDTSVVVANSASGGLGVPCVFSGDDVRCAGGHFAEGTASFDTGISAGLLFFLSVGYSTPGVTVHSPVGQMASGWATGHSVVTQVGYWAGEKTNGNTGTGFGARYLSDDSVIRLGSPNGASTTYTSVMDVTSIGTDGIVDLHWGTTSGDGSVIWWFAIGEAIPTPPTPSFHTTTFVRRRLRRSPILWSENQGLQTQVRVNLIAVDMQPGVSTQVETPDALVMVRASKDGGRTWTSERFVSVGAIGAYTQRLNTWRWGQGRQWVVEVSTSDPVTFNLIQLLIDAEPGTS